MTLEGDLAEWVATRPDWQKEAVARFCRNQGLSAEDVGEIADQLITGTHPASQGITATDIPGTSETGESVRLLAVADVSGVNALVPDQRLTFSDSGLTIIYGDNASGKSGYARLIRRAVTARIKAALLGDVFAKEHPAQSASFSYKVGAVDAIWSLSDASSRDLSAVRFYDEECGDAYVTLASEISYRPSALTLLDRLSGVCDDVQQELTRRLTANTASRPELPLLADGTNAKGFLNAIRADTTQAQIDEATELGPNHSAVLPQKLQELARLQGSDPSAEIARLSQFAADWRTVKDHVDRLGAHLVSGGKATIANMFVNMNSGRRGLVAQYDVICFDEVSGVSFDQTEGVNILKGYMESGEFSRGRESIRAEGGIVMVGNFDVDVETQLRVGHLLAPLPREMRDDTAFMDRIHAYIPGWDVPKLDPSYFTEHFGFVSDYLAEVWSQLRRLSRLDVLHGRLDWGSQLSGRDRKAVNNTVDGLLRLLYPDPQMEVPDEFLAWAASLALEMRRRVKEAQTFIGAAEFGQVELSYRLGDAPEAVVYCEESVCHRMRMQSEHEVQPGDSQAGEGEVLPAPDPTDVLSNDSARNYVAGDTIGGRFEVEEVLGSGGFTKVYRVRDVVEGEERALKLFDNAAGYDAVRREIGALRKVHHPKVVQVIWADRTDQGEWYLTLEYVDGETLAEYASGKKHLRDREAIDVALDVLEALIAIHPNSEQLDALEAKKRTGEISPEEFDELISMSDNALVHRDIKPQNIMLTRSGAKLLDFNIASRVGDPIHTVSGTPPYQPPDADLTRWDVSTDLLAVGVTLYELLCNGHHPYSRAKPMLDVNPRNPRQFRKNLNESLADFLLRSCANERSGRFESAAEMKSALETVRVSL